MRKAEAALLAGSIAAALAGVEISVRILYADDVNSERIAARLAETRLAPITRPSEIPELLYELRPNARVLWNGIRVETDEDGLRVSPNRRKPEPDAIRFAILGDSTSFGWKVEYDDAYPSRLAKLLARRTGRAVWLRNYSVPGYNSRSHQILLREKVSRWKPDLILVHCDLNDADPIDTKPPDYMTPETGDNALGSAAIKLLIRRVRAAANTPQDAGEREYIGPYTVGGPAFDRHVARLAAISAAAKSLNAPAGAYLFNAFVELKSPDEADPMRERYHRPLARRLSAAGFEVIDGYDAAQSWMRDHGWKNSRPLWLDPHDAHPNSTAHALAAAWIADGILSRTRLRRVFDKSR